MKRRWTTTTTIKIALGLPLLASAFGTINEPVILGQHNEHELITRIALQCHPHDTRTTDDQVQSDGICFEPRSLDQLAGYHRHVLGVSIPGAGFNGAVGAPDTLDPVPEGAEAHCDDADFIDDPSYPQTREEATQRLQICVDHLRARFRQAWGSAEMLLDERNRVRDDMVALSGPLGGDCSFAFAALQINRFGRAKCAALEGFGRALHGVQDFYSHSNWADEADTTRPVGVSNPPGLARRDLAPFLELRRERNISAEEVPRDLSTGCFAIPDGDPGSGACAGRVTHYALHKDHGVVHLNGSFGAVGPGSPRAEAVPGNFYRAVRAAVQSTRDTWAALREELRKRYGAVRGNLMICALVRDDPLTACRNRTVALTLDTSWRAGVHGASYVEKMVASELLSRLARHGIDKVTTIEFDAAARVVYPMGYPESVFLGEFLPGGETDMGGGLQLAIDETIRAQPETYADRGAVVVLTTGSESPGFVGRTLEQVQRAVREGVRIHYGCINLPSLLPNTSGTPPELAAYACDPGLNVVSGVLKTGGVFAYINLRSGRTPAHFARMVFDRGLAATDREARRSPTLYPGIGIARSVTPDGPPQRFSYSASPGENLNFTVQDLSPFGQGTGGCYTVAVINRELDAKVATYTACTNDGPLSLVYETVDDVDLILEVSYGVNGQDAEYDHEQISDGELVFVVELETTMAEKDDMEVEAEENAELEEETETTGETKTLTGETIETSEVTAVIKSGKDPAEFEEHEARDEQQEVPEFVEVVVETTVSATDTGAKDEL